MNLFRGGLFSRVERLVPVLALLSKEFNSQMFK